MDSRELIATSTRRVQRIYRLAATVMPGGTTLNELLIMCEVTLAAVEGRYVSQKEIMEATGLSRSAISNATAKYAGLFCCIREELSSEDSRRKVVVYEGWKKSRCAHCPDPDKPECQMVRWARAFLEILEEEPAPVREAGRVTQAPGRR